MDKAIVLPHTIGDGKDREVKILFADRWRKLVLIQLRRGALLDDHSARVPITIQAVAGNGILQVAEEEHRMAPGVLVPVDAQVIHSVRGDPDIAILVSFFRQGEGSNEKDTARIE